jgi:hypothetical protein
MKKETVMPRQEYAATSSYKASYKAMHIRAQRDCENQNFRLRNFPSVA